MHWWISETTRCTLCDRDANMWTIFQLNFRDVIKCKIPRKQPINIHCMCIETNVVYSVTVMVTLPMRDLCKVFLLIILLVAHLLWRGSAASVIITKLTGLQWRPKTCKYRTSSKSRCGEIKFQGTVLCSDNLRAARSWRRRLYIDLTSVTTRPCAEHYREVQT